MPERTRSSAPRPGPALLLAVAALSLGPAVIHFAVAPMHLQEYAPFGVFFVATGALQCALAVAALAAPSRPLFRAAAAGTLGLVALYLVSRTAGVPVGPHPGQPEAVGFPDVACVTMELVALVPLSVLSLRRPRARARRRHPVRVALAAAPLALLAGVLTWVGSASAAADMPVAYDVSPLVPGQASTNVALLTAAPGSEPVHSFTLTAEVARVGGQEAWTYDGTVPGPVLRVTLGERVRVTLVNHLPGSTTIHWHGVPGLPDADDGVAGVTQQAVAPGHAFTYEFVPSAAGTFWYHSHQDTADQLSRGLYGALVVEPPGGPTEDRDYTVVLHGAPAGGVAVNGAAGLRLAASPGETVRLRLVNAVSAGMDGGPEAPALVGAPFRVVALDGRDLNRPGTLTATRVALGMGQRADLVFTMPATGSVRLVDTEVQGALSGFQKLVTPPDAPLPVVTVGSGGAPPALDAARLPVLDVTAYGAPAADPVAAARLDAAYPVVIADSPGFHDGRIELVHTINGAASPAVPPITVHEGQVVRLHIVNTTGEYHPMHLHGHTMTVLSRDGVPLSGSPVHLDTVLVGPRQTWDVAFLADNPGVWMLHCHVPIHASFGLSMTVRYAGYWTPYTMGTRSGNLPE